MKKIIVSLLIVTMVVISGCSRENYEGEVKEESNVEITEHIKENKTIINEVDFSESFNNINGGAVFYDATNDVYNIYEADICNEQIPPYSTFKIVNSLMGLSQGVVNSAESTLGYDGTIHWKEEWNKDLNLREAFKESCLWYYQKIMDSLDKQYVQETLNSLKFGNCDITEWNDSEHNTFWIDGSLKISAVEQVKVLTEIFEGNSIFKDEHVELVKELMLVDAQGSYSVYGKTGSARTKNAWFIGFVENHKGEKIYFAVRLDDESQELAGAVAKEIALDIINKNYDNLVK